jgi:hypothetical protein
MKKQQSTKTTTPQDHTGKARKLRLSRETLSTLSRDALANVAGGVGCQVGSRTSPQ